MSNSAPRPIDAPRESEQPRTPPQKPQENPEQKQLNLIKRIKDSSIPKAEQDKLIDRAKNISGNLQAGLASIEQDFERVQKKIQQDKENAKKPVQVSSSDPNREISEQESERQRVFEEFRDVASDAIRNSLFNNGKLDIHSLKTAMMMATQLSQLQLPEEMKDIDNAEKAELAKRLPAVKGIVGASFVDAMFKQNYQIHLNNNGVVVGAVRGVDPASLDLSTVNNVLNTQLNANPAFKELLHAGLLFHGGDLVNYAQQFSDHQGNMRPDAVNYRKFISFLDNNSTTQAAHALK